MMHEKKKRVALIFFGLVITVLITEGLLRFFGWGFHYLQERQNRESTLTKDVQLAQSGYIQLNRDEGKELVVVCIGESTTALGGVNSWPRQLQRILNNMQDQKTFRVINKGLPSRNTDAILKYLPSWLNEYKPDFVLAMVGINDKFSESSPEKNSLRHFRWPNLLSHFKTYGLIEWIAGGIKARITKKTEDVATPNVEEEGDNRGKLVFHGLRDLDDPHLHPRTIRNLNNMVNLTTDQGINFVFVQYALRKIDILTNVIEHQNVVYISNYKIFVDLLRQYNYDDLFVDDFSGDFGHATTFGNRIIADNVARQLLINLELQEQSN